jgi:hypothetical protein
MGWRGSVSIHASLVISWREWRKTGERGQLERTRGRRQRVWSRTTAIRGRVRVCVCVRRPRDSGERRGQREERNCVAGLNEQRRETSARLGATLGVSSDSERMRE